MKAVSLCAPLVNNTENRVLSDSGELIVRIRDCSWLTGPCEDVAQRQPGWASIERSCDGKTRLHMDDPLLEIDRETTRYVDGSDSGPFFPDTLSGPQLHYVTPIGSQLWTHLAASAR